LKGEETAVLITLFIACDPGTVGYSGTSMSEFFPLDGSRAATYTNDDASVPYKLAMQKIEPTTQGENREIVVLEYSEDEGDTLFFSVGWSVQAGDAVQVHNYSVGTGELITFDPPLQITDDDDAMRTGESIVFDTTGSDGSAWTVTSTYVEPVPECPTLYTDKWTDCVRVTIDDGDGDDSVGLPFAGDYTLVTGYGPAYMTVTGDSAAWDLTNYTYVAP
jgi:hypothetical protein